MKRKTLKERAALHGNVYHYTTAPNYAGQQGYIAGYRAAQRDAKAAAIDNPKRKLRISRFDTPVT